MHPYTTNFFIINQIKLLEIELRLLLDSIVILEAQRGVAYLVLSLIGETAPVHEDAVGGDTAREVFF